MEGLPPPQTTTDFYLQAILQKLEAMSPAVAVPSSGTPGEEVELREPEPQKKGNKGSRGRKKPEKE